MKTLKVTIETPKWGFIKRKDDGSIDYISPIPSPFNYGSVPNTVSEDGDRLDAIVLGKKRKFGEIVEVPVIGVVKFYDKGEYDPKHICSENEPTLAERITLQLFFRVFVFAKKVYNKLRGKKGETKLESINL